MTRVIVQAGHSNRFTPFANNGGGAPGEAQWTSDLADKIALRLRDNGVEVDLVGAWLVTLNGAQVTLAPPAAVTRDADLFLSLHYDAAVYGASKNTGAFADHAQGEPYADDSLRFIKLWEDLYFKLYPQGTGLPNMTARRNPNTSQYYGFKATTSNTPSVLIEHGVGAQGAGQDADLLWNHLDHIADLDAWAIMAYLGVGVPGVPPAPLPPVATNEEDDVLPDDPRLLSDEEMEEDYRPLVWGEHYAKDTGNFAIPARWKQLVREGRDPGAPLDGEQRLKDRDWVIQRFERMTITWRDGKGTSVRA